MMSSKSSLPPDISRWLVVVLCFSAPLSRAMFNTSLLLLIVACTGAVIFSKWRPRFLSQSLTISISVLFLWILVGLVYTPALLTSALGHMKVYCYLMLVLLIISLLDDKKWQQRALNGFSIAMIIVIVFSYIDIVIDLPWSQHRGLGLDSDHSIFADYIVQSLETSFFIIVCLHWAEARSSLWQRRFAIAIAVAGAASVLFLLQSRTGLIALVVVAAAYLFTRFNWRRSLVGLMGVGLAFVIFVWLSPVASARIGSTITELQALSPIGTNSVNIRWATWVASMDMFLSSPIFGNGTGSYPVLAATYFKDCTWHCVHPHNQYLSFLVENGLIGVSLYLCVLVCAWRIALSATVSRPLVVAFLALLSVNSALNAPLWFHMEAYFFYTMLGIVMSMALRDQVSEG